MRRWAEVDLSAIRHNVGRLRELQPPGVRLLAVVKANAYGHGAQPVSRAALEAGAWGLAVSTLEEAAELGGLVEPERLLALGGLTPADAPAAVAAGCAVVCSNPELAEALADAADPARPLPVHLKIDTGMSRLGCAPAQAPELARIIAGSRSLTLAGTMTHFASSESDPTMTRAQHELFADTVAAFDVEPGLLHANNSAGALRWPEFALDAVRCGIALYGCEGRPEDGLRPALALRATVVQVRTVPAGATAGYGATWRAERESRLATVTLGYADGLHRSRSNRGFAIVHGTRVPIAGRVSMDAVVLDVSDAPAVVPGDAATFVGPDAGERVTAEEAAGWAGTISYEVLTAIGSRVERRYSE